MWRSTAEVNSGPQQSGHVLRCDASEGLCRRVHALVTGVRPRVRIWWWQLWAGGWPLRPSTAQSRSWLSASVRSVHGSSHLTHAARHGLQARMLRLAPCPFTAASARQHTSAWCAVGLQAWIILLGWPPLAFNPSPPDHLTTLHHHIVFPTLSTPLFALHPSYAQISTVARSTLS